MTTPDLFHDGSQTNQPVPIADGAVLLPRFARAAAPELTRTVEQVAALAPFRHMQTPGGHTMTVAMTCCGAVGWSADPQGYRYTARDPLSGKPWPGMPASLAMLARRAAERAGYPDFAPDTCLINRYLPAAKLSPHQDRDERDLGSPIVSVSIGLPAVFQFGGVSRKDRLRRMPLESGDVVVWGGPSRLAYHGVLPLASGNHPVTGESRLNLSFRRAL